MIETTVLPATSLERRILKNGAFQARDAGRYPTVEGKWIRAGRLFRSDALSSLTAVDVAEFESIGVGLVIDLREKREADAAPDVLPGNTNYIRLPVFEESLFERDFNAFPSLLGQYEIIITEHAPQLTAVVATIAENSSSPLIVHCTAGKDRTGLVIALVQLLLGLEEQTVLEDFGASEKILGVTFQGVVRELYTHAGLPTTILGTQPHKAPPSYLAATLQALRDQYGSPESFLIEHGLRLDQIATLRENLLRPDSQ